MKQFLGFALVISAAIILSMEGKLEKLKINSIIYRILIADILLAIAAILIKFTINANSFSKIFSYESWGLFLGGVLLYAVSPMVRNAFKESFTSVGKKVLSIMFMNELIYVVSKTIQFLAVSLGPVSLVAVLGSTQVFYGIMYGWLLTAIAPHTFKEGVTKNELIKKFTLGIVMLLGIILIG